MGNWLPINPTIRTEETISYLDITFDDAGVKLFVWGNRDSHQFLHVYDLCEEPSPRFKLSCKRHFRVCHRRTPLANDSLI